MRVFKRPVVIALTVLTLVACGSMHPGDAAIVDSQSISMMSLDHTARIYCLLALRSGGQQGVGPVSNMEVRRQAITDMVTAMVAEKVAVKKGVTPRPQTYEITASQRQQIDKAFPADSAAVSKAIENSQKTSAIAVALGAKATGAIPTAANQSDLAHAGQAEILKAFTDHDVQFSPRFGMSGTMKKMAPTGSMSVAEIAFDQPIDTALPAAQRCG